MEELIDLREVIKGTKNFVNSYENFIQKEHDMEFICAEFEYEGDLQVIMSNANDNWNLFKNQISEDFKVLDYPPCFVYVFQNMVHAHWFTPTQFLMERELTEEEKALIISKLQASCESLESYRLKEIAGVLASREISEDHYLERYYRGEQFLKYFTLEKGGK